MALQVAQEKRTRLGNPNTVSMCAFSHALVMGSARRQHGSHAG